MAVNLFLSLLFVVHVQCDRIFNLSKHTKSPPIPIVNLLEILVVFFPFRFICLNWISFIMKNHDDNFTIFSFSLCLVFSTLFIFLNCLYFLCSLLFFSCISFALCFPSSVVSRRPHPHLVLPIFLPVLKHTQFTDTDIKTKICCRMPTHSHYHRIESNAIIRTVRKRI